MVQIGGQRVAAHIQPQAMNKLHIVRAERGRVRTDEEDLGFAAWANDVVVELALGLGQRLPCLAHMEGLIFDSHGTRHGGNYRIYFE